MTEREQGNERHGAPRRIVSLLPAATEILTVLGLRDRLVGVTHECDYPADVRDLPKVTRTLIPPEASSREIDQLVRSRMASRQPLYSLDLPTLHACAPDLIVTQALCDVCAVAEAEVAAAACELPGRPPVINLEPETLREVLDSIRTVAQAASLSADEANAVIGGLEGRIQAVADRSRSLAPIRIGFLEWLDPPFSCGHWSPELVRLAGGLDGFSREGERSRTLRWDEIIAWQPEALFIACCGFDIERTLRDLAATSQVPGWETIPAVRSGRVYVVDGSHYFSRPGPRLVDSLEILAHALHPDVHPLPAHLPAAVCAARTPR